MLCFVCFLMSGDCCVALPQDGTVRLQFVIVLFPDHTHYILIKILMLLIRSLTYTHMQSCDPLPR